MCTYIDTIDIPDEVISLIFNARACLHNFLDSSDSVSYQVSNVYSGIPGRSKWFIDEEHQEFWISEQQLDVLSRVGGDELPNTVDSRTVVR